MVKFEVFIVGSGKLASELLSGLCGNTVSHVTRWKSRDPSRLERGIVVHAGSGRELEEVMEFCDRTNSVLFELSTSGSEFPKSLNFPVVLCPNVNLLILQFMAMIRMSAANFRDYGIAITESHQSSKKTKPGTAIYLAKALGIPETEIRSVREPEIQIAEIGIPEEYIDRHAYHKIVISDQEAEILLEAKVLGKAAYAASLGKIIDRLSQKELPPGLHDIVELLVAEQNR